MSATDMSPPDIHLPSDVWLHTSLEANPLDVLSLSQTCKALYSLFSQISAWKAILRVAMRKYGPFIVSYSLDDLTLSGLQRAATRLDRWKRFTLTNPQSKFQGSETTLQAPEHGKGRTTIPELRRNGSSYRLIPGGRFLLVAGVREDEGSRERQSSANVTLWDLNPESDVLSLEPVQVSSHLIAGGVYPTRRPLALHVDVCITGETELAVVAALTGTSKHTKSAVVLKISLESSERTFKVVLSIQFLANSLGFPFICGNRVLLVHSDGFLLWNITKVRSLPHMFRWKSPYFPNRGVKDTVFTNDYVVSILDTGIQVWDISKLNDLMRHDTGITVEHPLELEPHLFIPARWPPVRIGTYATPTKIHHTSNGSCSEIMFDIIFPSEFNKPKRPARVLRYELTLAKSPSGPIEAGLVLRGAGHLPRRKCSLSTSPSGGVCFDPEGRVGCDQLYWYFPLDCDSLNATSNVVDDISSKMPITLAPIGRGQVLATCPIMGRVVYICQGDEESEDSDIIICDDDSA